MKTIRLTSQIARVVTAGALIMLTGAVHGASVTVEAESGARGTNFVVRAEGGMQYITCTNNNTGTSPGIPGRVVTYSITFPEPGTYKLYARVRVSSIGGGANNDSMFYANGFGTKAPANEADWITCNNLWNAGFVNPSDIATGQGSATTDVWKWINLSEYTGAEPPITFSVPAAGLTQTFQIGGREDGFDVDKLLFGTADYTYTVAELDAGGPGTPPPPPRPRDLVGCNLIQFNDNGAWCWYQDERVVVDAVRSKLITGSDASGAGVGGSARNGAIEAVVFDLQTGAAQRFPLLASGVLGCDDHNAPAFMVRPDGKYLAQYAGHNDNFLNYFRVFDGTAWGPQFTFDWTTQGAGTGEQVSYSNPYYLAAENRIYSFTRCMSNRSPHILVSTNYGDSWFFGGQLVRPDGVVGYNSGYFRYSGDGVGRIDFICTEAHPRDIQTSIYHGYISNGMALRTDGTVVDTNVFDRICPVSRDFTLVFSNGTVMPPGMTNFRCWNSDVQRYSDGTIACIIHARINQVASGGYPDTVDPNHSFFYCRFDGTNWRATYLCQAGHKLYSAEADYVGLGCLDPNDPNTIYISTRYDPRAVVPGMTDTNPPYSAFREIWKGITTNNGQSFTWTPITMDSTRDNCRPHMPVWDSNNRALLWWRGRYNSAQSYDTAIVGIIDRRDEILGPMTYVDATTNNTFLAATGEPLVTGPGTGQWHERAGGNGGTLFASADAVAENAPMLKTVLDLPEAGTYELWVNFWGNPSSSADWRIMAGLSTNQMQIFRQMASKVVRAGDHQTGMVLTNNNTNYLYQAYVGCVAVSNNTTVDVFVDDYPIQTGTTGTLIGNTARTWYDGVSYAKVDRLRILDAKYIAGAPGAVMVTWNSMPAETTLFSQQYAVQRTESLEPADWVTIAVNIPAAGFTTSFVDTNPPANAAFYRVVRQ